MNDWMLGLLISFILLAWLTLRALADWQAASWLAEFEERFPEKCALCAHYRYGRIHYGHTEHPPEHTCKEDDA